MPLTPEQRPSQSARGWIEPELALLLAIVCVIYLTRLAAPNLRGEETRRGRVAVEMIQTGDWIVPRQQGQLFLSRPPLQNWLIGLCGLVRGEVDWLAIRLPSALATILLAGLIYSYARGCLSPAGSLVAGLSFATMIQV
ncbi:MAG TPA: glycosyltransferase family 39 protein, partial [Pirellulaceae bacterium]|nr:glycosyltransferase family 39 protein [Pirellulaceae bacterium]